MDIPVKGNNKRKAEEKRKELLAEYEAVAYDAYRLFVYNQIVPFFEPKSLKVNFGTWFNRGQNHGHLEHLYKITPVYNLLDEKYVELCNL